MGKFANGQNFAEICCWQSAYIPDQSMAVSYELSEGRQTGAIQQSRRAEHQAFCDGPKELAFANVQAGAQSSAVIYSLIQTAMENKLDPYRYLTWLLKTANTADLTDEQIVKRLLPWNAPGECAARRKKHGAFLVNFVIDFANGDMSRFFFELDYSGYVIEHFPEFEREHPRLSRRFADTIDLTYSNCSWMDDDAFRDAIGEAVDEFLGVAPQLNFD